MKILKGKFTESTGVVKLNRRDMYSNGYDIEGDSGYYASGKFRDGVDFDIVTDDSSTYAEINAFPDNVNENIILKVNDCSTETAVKNLLSELESMSMSDAKSKYKSIFESVNEDTEKDLEYYNEKYGTEFGARTKELVDQGMEELEAAKQAVREYTGLVTEDTVKTKDGKWTNKGKEGTHGKFDTKKQADDQRKAMFANGYQG